APEPRSSSLSTRFPLDTTDVARLQPDHTMSRRLAATAALGAALAAAPAGALPTRSSPLAVAPDGHVFVVNPDSSRVARLDFRTPPGMLTHERAVGQYPRTLALDGTHVRSEERRVGKEGRLK